MTNAFLYDSLCGMVYRCMFAGVDDCGRAQWVNITPGEEPKTLNDYVIDEDLQGTRFFVLAMEGETAQSSQVAKILGKVMECPVDELTKELTLAVRHMQDMGVKWDFKPLELEFRVFENEKGSRRSGKYSFWLEDSNNYSSFIADIDGFDSLEDLFCWIRIYLYALEETAKIPVITKDLRISDDLRRKVRKSDLGMFSHIVKEDNFLLDKEEE